MASLRAQHFLLPGLALVLGLCGPARAAGAAAEELSVNAIAFVCSPALPPDRQVGLAVGDAGLILLTADGGKSWQPRTSGTSAHLLAVALVDERVAYAAGRMSAGPLAGSTGVLLKTDNGGESWRAVGDLACAGYWGVSVCPRPLDPDGRAVCAWGEPGPDAPSGLFASADAGQTWKPIKGRLAERVLAVFWSSAERIYALTADGAAWRWEGGALEPVEGSAPPAAAGESRLTAAQMLDAQTWLVALEAGRLMMTTDAGRAWRAVRTDGPPGACGVRWFHFVNQTEGWFVGVGPAGLQYTTSGGLRWKRTGPAPAGPLRAAWFQDAWNGVVAGPFGSLYRTTDGGGTWATVRCSPRRAALVVIQPYGSVGDWPLVSMLAGDRGYRTLLWWATNPSDESVLLTERRLRDAAQFLGGAEALILGGRPSARFDGPAGLEPAASMPRGDFKLGDEKAAAAALAAEAALVAEALKQWQPAVVLAPDKAGADAEETFVGQAVEQAAQKTVVALWLADPQNETAARSPGASSEYDVAVNPLAASEEFGVYHGVRAQMAAQLVRRWPTALAESLGYRRIAVAQGEPSPLALLQDLARADAAARRDVGPAARFSLRERAAWDKEAADFFPQFKAALLKKDFNVALTQALAFGRAHPALQLGSASLEELWRRAAGSDLTAAGQAIAAMLALGPAWPPRRVEAMLWLMDVNLAAEAAGPQPEPAAALGRARELRSAIEKLAPQLLMRPDIQYQWLRRFGPAGEAGQKELVRLAQFAAQWSADPALAKTIELERWNRDGRLGDSPVRVIELKGEAGGATPKTDEQAPKDVDLGQGLVFKLQEKAGGLVFFIDLSAARAWHLAIDMDRDARTLLVEPFADPEPPPQQLIASAAAPVWFRRPRLWRREEQGRCLAVQLCYDALGGRPAPGTLWMITLREQATDGGRPGQPAPYQAIRPALHDAGCFAVLFQ